MTKYPILTENCLPTPAYTITAKITDPNLKIDGSSVVTSFNWKSNSDSSSTGVVMGNSTSTFINGKAVVILDPSVMPYISYAGQTSSTCD